MTDDKTLGTPVPNWSVPPAPDGAILQGRAVRLEPLSAAHVADLHAANVEDAAIWDYLPYGPFASEEDYGAWVAWASSSRDPRFYAICDTTSGRASGVASYLRINPEAGSIEVGHINFAKRLQQTRAATEAMALMMQWAFSNGYRRYEWKCNALNLGSRRAAERLGLSFEGVFRQAAVIKGRNRDTAWFAAIDAEWPALDRAFAAWLDPSNFGPTGHQKRRLSDLTRPVLVAQDPGLTRA